MPAPATRLPVTGSPHPQRTDLQVLDERLGGHDTFLTGVLETGARSFPVRILTLDDVTVLRLLDDAPHGPREPWTGHLLVAHGARPVRPPDDLLALVAERGADLTALDEAELRYALTFLAEASTPAIRAERAAVIVGALPALGRGG